MAIYMMRDVNTYLAHYPLTTTSTTSDISGNSKNMTQSGTVTFGTYGGVNCAYFNGGYLYLNESLVLGGDPRTINCWFNRTSAVADGGAFWGMGNASSENGITTYLHGNAPATGKYGYGNWATNRDVGFSVSPSLNTWYLLTATYDGTDLLLYVNANYLGTPTIGEYSGTNTITLNLTSGKTTICCMPNLGGTGFKGYMSEFIFDGTTWTAQEVLNYYNDTKSNYGIGVLPSAYQEVEYIQSTATNPGADNSSGQYIDTLYTHNPNTKISIDIQFTTTAKQQRLFGVSTASSSYSTFAAYINGSTQRARATKDGDGNRQTTRVSADTNRHTFVLQNSNYVIYTNGATTYSGNNGNTMTKGGSHTLPLLCTWLDGDGKYLCHASAKLYSCKIWDNGTLVRDFVPCYRKSDTVIGLYDLVNNQFYTNAGSGTFTKGADV